MIIHAWRIVKAGRAATAFSGSGAKEFGGRWNSPGIPVVCLAGSASLAILEMLVHLRAEEMLRHFNLFQVSFDEALMTVADLATLPRSWQYSPPPASVQRIGDLWLAKGESAILRVPSVIVPTEWNYLLNPAHRDFRKITIGPKRSIRFDPRLMKTPLRGGTGN